MLIPQACLTSFPPFTPSNKEQKHSRQLKKKGIDLLKGARQNSAYCTIPFVYRIKPATIIDVAGSQGMTSRRYGGTSGGLENSISPPACWLRACIQFVKSNVLYTCVVCTFLYAIHRSCSVVSDSLRPHGLQPTRLLGPWDFPGMNTGVGCRFLLQGIFLIQGSNPGLPHCRQTLYRLSYRATQNQAVSRICPCELQFADSLFQMVLPPMLGNQPALEIVASAASSGFSSDDCLSSISLAWAFQVVVARQSGSVHSHVAQVQRWSAEKSATFFWPKHVIREGGI